MRAIGNVRFEPIGLDDATAVQRFGQRRCEVAGLLHAARRAPCARSLPMRSIAHATGGRTTTRDQRELPILVDHHRRIGDELRGLESDGGNASRDRVAHLRRVVEHGRDELAGVHGVQRGQVAADQPIEHVALGDSDHAFADRVDNGLLAVPADRAHSH